MIPNHSIINNNLNMGGIHIEFTYTHLGRGPCFSKYVDKLLLRIFSKED